MSSETSDSSAFEYDVVIVGGGTAGCVLASKLSARAPKLRFLLLEAGPNNNDDPRVRTPLKSRRMFENEDFDWCLKSVPQAGLNGREISQTRGKMLGGSSAINSHSLVYPNKEMHDAWAQLVGDKRWSWDSMAKYYKRFQGAGEEGEGFVEASLPSKPNRVQKAWVEAFEELGHIATDPSDGKAIGGTTTTNAINSRGERSHSGNAFLEPAMGRANLTVKTISLVEKIALHQADSDFCAEGVHYSSRGRRFFVKATREVILCAGVYGSPQLLELSGIGQRDVLQTANVDPILDLAGVGENLQDHLNYGPSVEVRPEIETLDFVDYDESAVAEQQRQYDQDKSGALADGGAYSFAYMPLQLLDEMDEALHSNVAAHQAKHSSLRNEYIYDSLLSPDSATATILVTRKARYAPKLTAADGKYITFLAMLSYPFSRGMTHIRSANPAEPPFIDPRYLQDDLDAEILARHVIQFEKLMQLSAFKEVILQGGRRFPRAFDKPAESVEDVKTAIRKHGATNYHPCGTCAMMKMEDDGVVDESLKVHGTKNLRICDASIFPIIPRGNILTTVYAVAERAADVLLQDWSKNQWL